MLWGVRFRAWRSGILSNPVKWHWLRLCGQIREIHTQIICLFWWEQMVSPSRIDRAQCSQLAIKRSVVQEVVPYLGLSVHLCCWQGPHSEATEARSTSAGWSPYWDPCKASNLATWSLCEHAFLVRTQVIDDKALQISTGWVTFPVWFLVPLPWWMISDGHWCVI